MGPEDFDPEALHRLVDDAITPVPGPARAVFGAVAPRASVFAVAAEVLGGELPLDVVTRCLTEVRDRLATPPPGDLATLHTRASRCRRCRDLAGPPGLPRGNLARPDVAVVSSWLDDPDLGPRLAAAGLAPGRVAQLALCRCRPPTPRVPTTLERRTCTETWLYDELELLAPKVIVCLGAAATEAFLGSDVALGEVRGQLCWLGPWAIMATWHPGAARHRPERDAELTADLALVARCLYGDPPSTP